MGLPCELPPALHPGRGWGLCGLFHAKSLLDPPPSLAPAWGRGCCSIFIPGGRSCWGDPWLGPCFGGGPAPLDKGPPALPVPWQDLL